MSTDRDWRISAISERLVARLKGERIRKGLSQNELARRSGLSQSMVLRVENGERCPTVETLLRMADGLGLNVGEVLAKAVAEVDPQRSD